MARVLPAIFYVIPTFFLMPKSRFQRSRITSVVTSIPSNRRSIDDEIEQYGGDRAQIERIKKTIGLRERYVVDAKTTAGDLCETAARVLLADAGVAADAVDGLVMVTQTPDYFQPATACVLHGRLGMSKECAAFDVNLGCSGYVYGLWLASMMIESGGCDRVLLLAGDTISRCVNPRDRTVAPLFGDAGSATLVEASESAAPSFFDLKTEGGGFGHIIVPAGAFRQPPSEETRREAVDESGNVRTPENLYMNGAEVFNFSLKVEPDALRDIVNYAGVELDDVSAFVLHQANRYIIGNIARRLKVSADRVPAGTVEKYGNQSCASIPSTICDHFGDKVVRESASVVLSGFGVGLSWASCYLVLDRLKSCRIVTHRDLYGD